MVLQDKKAIIFDLDGTLVTSTLAFSTIKEQIECPPDEDLLLFIAGLSAPFQKQAAEVVWQHEWLDAQTSEVLPGVKNFIDDANSKGLKMGVVTRNSRLCAEEKIRRSGLDIGPIIAREDAPPKPHPSGLLYLSEQWQIAPSDIAMIGDYHYDLTAAKRAGMSAGLYDPESNSPFADQADFRFGCYHELRQLCL